MKKLAILAAMAALSVGILAGCGGGAATPITVTAGENGQLAFSPATLPLTKGTKYELTFVNKDSAQSHSIVSKDAGLNSGLVAPGQTKKVTFTPNKSGEIPFDCDVPGHKESGMVGTFSVK